MSGQRKSSSTGRFTTGRRWARGAGLENISLEVRQREFLALLGPSGCGKSTLLYLIGGFLPTETGKILVDGKPVRGPGPDRGIVFQHFALFPWKTVRKNVLYGLERQGLPRAEREARAQSFIDLVGLSGVEDSYPLQLSGGIRAHSDRAHARLRSPHAADGRADGALDAQTRSLMQTELLSIWEKTRKTSVIATHDVHEALSRRALAVMSARPAASRPSSTPPSTRPIPRSTAPRCSWTRSRRSGASSARRRSRRSRSGRHDGRSRRDQARRPRQNSRRAPAAAGLCAAADPGRGLGGILAVWPRVPAGAAAAQRRGRGVGRTRPLRRASQQRHPTSTAPAPVSRWPCGRRRARHRMASWRPLNLMLGRWSKCSIRCRNRR